MKRINPRKLAAIIAAAALLGLATVVVKEARRPAVVVMEGYGGNLPDTSLPCETANGESSAVPVADVEDRAVAVSAPDRAGESIIVHVAGEVVCPGVYVLSKGSRVADALRAAGGGTAEADTDMVNLALPIHDGEQIYVPHKQSQTLPSQEMSPPPNRANIEASSPTEGLININTASVTELQQLSGIGPAIAARIVEYREKHGPYSSVRDLLDVSGIGEAKLSKITPYITVR